MNLTPPEYPHDAQIAAAVRARLPSVRAIYRYGSAGGEFERAESDLDVGVRLMIARGTE